MNYTRQISFELEDGLRLVDLNEIRKQADINDFGVDAEVKMYGNQGRVYKVFVVEEVEQ